MVVLIDLLLFVNEAKEVIFISSYIKSAILFSDLKAGVPIPFSHFKLYNLGTGYVILYDQTEQPCVICRILDSREIEYFKKSMKKIVFKFDTGEIKEINAIIIKSGIINFFEAEKQILKKHNI